MQEPATSTHADWGENRGAEGDRTAALRVRLDWQRGRSSRVQLASGIKKNDAGPDPMDVLDSGRNGLVFLPDCILCVF